jgi:hypothetical protein
VRDNWTRSWATVSTYGKGEEKTSRMSMAVRRSGRCSNARLELFNMHAMSVCAAAVMWDTAWKPQKRRRPRCRRREYVFTVSTERRQASDVAMLVSSLDMAGPASSSSIRA